MGCPPIMQQPMGSYHTGVPLLRACMDFGLQWMKVRYWDVMMLKMERRVKTACQEKVRKS